MGRSARARWSALGLALTVSAAGLQALTPYAAADPTGPQLSVVVSADRWSGTFFGDLEWRGGSIYAIRAVAGDTYVASWDDGAMGAAQPAHQTLIPDAWTSDGFWQSNRDAFSVARNGDLYVRAPYYNRGAGGADPMAYGWGVGKLDTDGTMTPASVPPGGRDYENELSDNSESIALDPDGSGFIIGGARHKPGGYSYGVVAKIPLPVPVDQQVGAEIIASADAYDSADSSTYHGPPFLASQDLVASTQPFMGSIGDVDAKGRYVYVNDSGYNLYRIDRRTDRIVSICCGKYEGWNTPPPVEGGRAMDTWFQIGAGPVADRAGNVFFASGGSDRFNGNNNEIWEIRADGTLHHVAGTMTDGVAAGDGVDPLTVALPNVNDLVLDPDGNLYVSINDFGGDRRILKLSGIGVADTAPSAPRDLTVVNGETSLDVSWDEPSDDGGQPVTGYTVRLHPHGVSGAAQDVEKTVTTRSTSVTGLTSGTAYDVSVLATNGVGNGPTASVSGTPAPYAAALTAPADATAGTPVVLDASGSHVPDGSTFTFYCDGRSTVTTPATGDGDTAACTFQRGSSDAGYVARVVATSGQRTWEATTPIVVSDPPNTIEGSAAFDPGNPDLTIPVDANRGVSFDQTALGAHIVMRAAPGTFRTGTTIHVYQGDDATLQAELGDTVQVKGGFAVTWSADGQKYDLTLPLMVYITPTQAAANRAAGTQALGGWDLGAALQSWGTGFVQGVSKAAQTIGSGLAWVGNAINQWAHAPVSITNPNNSATNDVVTCSGALSKTGANSYFCEGTLTQAKSLLTGRIASLDAGGRVVAAGGANVVASGGANVVAAGGANVVAAGGANITLPAAAVIAAGGGNVIAPGGANVIAPGGGNLIGANGAPVVAAGGGNVIAAGGGNVVAPGGGNRTAAQATSTDPLTVQLMLTRDPAFAFADPADPTPPTATLVLDPPMPESGVYPAGTEVQAHLSATAAGSKTVQSVHYAVSGAQTTASTLVADDEADFTITRAGTSTIDVGAADDNLAESPQQSVQVTIAKASQQLTFTQPAGQVYGDDDFDLEASASSELDVVLTSLTTPVCTLDGPTLHIVGAGTCQVEATQDGDDDHLAAPSVTRSFTVSKAPLKVTAPTAQMVKKGTVPTVAPLYTGFAATGESPRALTRPATCTVTVKKKRTSCAGAVSPNYRISYRTGRLQVMKNGYAFTSPLALNWTVGRKVKQAVEVDAARAVTLKWPKRLPPGITATTNRKRTSLTFTGKPTRAGSWTIEVTAYVGKKKVATQKHVVTVY